MAKGGARANSGPPPDPFALRRDRKDDAKWTTLPADGRKGKPPVWPLAEQTDRESTLWATEWRRPQAVMWERNGQELEVALYVRSVVAAEQLDAPTNARTLVRQQQEALGISLPGLARNHWRIAGDAETVAAKAGPRAPSRGRFTVVPGGKSSAAA